MASTSKQEVLPISEDENVMQKHAAFFDRDHDGVIYPWETYKGFRAIGSGVIFSAGAALFINIATSRKTRPGESFSLKFPIVVKNIQLSKHGSDTGVYDTQGRFVLSKFEEIFTKYAKKYGNALTLDELKAMLKARREPKNYSGWILTEAEWMILFYLGKDKNGLLHKHTIKAVYDGSLFEQMEKERLSANRI